MAGHGLFYSIYGQSDPLQCRQYVSTSNPWIYGADDPFYPLPHARENFEAFQAAGGRGAFHTFAPPHGVTGHNLWAYPDLWGHVVTEYLNQLELPIPMP
jgi:hypothetical protein